MKALKQLFIYLRIMKGCQEQAFKNEISELKQDIYDLVGNDPIKRNIAYGKWHLHKELKNKIFTSLP